jgi:DNA (cytosine-5)-methyltransferase 1
LSKGGDGQGSYAGRRREDDVNLVAACLNSGGNNGGFRTEPGEHLVANPLLGKANSSHDESLETYVSHALNGKSGDRYDGESETFVAIHGTDRTARAASCTDVAGALRNRAPGGIENSSTTAALDEWGVRRLTPLECERLQGFPDNYTLVRYRGKPAKDGPRYRAIGNSMSRPVMEWIGRRIDACQQ